MFSSQRGGQCKPNPSIPGSRTFEGKSLEKNMAKNPELIERGVHTTEGPRYQSEDFDTQQEHKPANRCKDAQYYLICTLYQPLQIL